MSFTEMMSSGRGPGVIGMLMALVVLIGFGFLFMFASDESSMASSQSIESVIIQQDKDIGNYQGGIEYAKTNLEKAPKRLAAAKELARCKREIQTVEGRIGDLKKGMETGNAALAATAKAFETYKDEYRAFARGKAKGELMDELVTLSGVVYKNVNIREVTPIGIQIRHADGQKRIPFEELSKEIQDRFQFDPNQKEQAIAAETTTRADHEAAVGVANEKAEQEMALQRERDAQLGKEKLKREIALKKSQISVINDEIRGIERQSDQAAAAAAAARSAGRMHINKSGSYASQIRTKKNQISALKAEIQEMSSRL